VKEIEGLASTLVAAPVEDCFSLLAAVDRYPAWNGELLRQVEVLEWEGDRRPAMARAMLHVAQSPFDKDFELVVAVRCEPPRTVSVIKVSGGPFHRERLALTWHLHPDAGTRIELEFHATASFLPSLLPLFGVGDLIAGTLLQAAARELARRERSQVGKFAAGRRPPDRA
jgi:ribosome-associated toxin RatA of RatAB toxin-antitoxin module